MDRILESNTNPRRVFDDVKLRELADNTKVHGVLQAILLRPSPAGGDGTYELVAGARRFRASKLAGKSTIPATVRDPTDAECREIQLIENLQRADMSVTFRVEVIERTHEGVRKTPHYSRPELLKRGLKY